MSYTRTALGRPVAGSSDPSVHQVLEERHDEEGYPYFEVWDPQKPLVENALSHNWVRSAKGLDPRFEMNVGSGWFNRSRAMTFEYSPGSEDAAEYVINAYPESWIIVFGDAFAPLCAQGSNWNPDCKVTLYSTDSSAEAMEILTGLGTRRLYLLQRGRAAEIPERERPPGWHRRFDSILGQAGAQRLLLGLGIAGGLATGFWWLMKGARR